jgi:hypothetical protein
MRGAAAIMLTAGVVAGCLSSTACGGADSHLQAQETGVVSSELGRCEEGTGSGPLEVSEAVVVADQLRLAVTYTACSPQTVRVCWNGEFLEESPAQAKLRPSVPSSGERCDKRIEQTVNVDLGPVIKEYRSGNSTPQVTVQLVVEGWKGVLLLQQ